VAFADASPFPAPESLYDDVYVLGGQVRGWYSVDTLGVGGIGVGAPDNVGLQSETGAVPQAMTAALEAGEDQ
jgi:hypothetical protein